MILIVTFARTRAGSLVILLSNSPFLRTMRKTIDSDFSGQNTPSVISLLKLQGIFVLEFTNEIPDDTIEDDVRNIRGDIVTEKVFGFYRIVRNDSDASNL